MSEDDSNAAPSRLERALVENNQRLKNIQFTLRTISFWMMLIFVVLMLSGFFYIWRKGALDWSGSDLASRK